MAVNRWVGNALAVAQVSSATITAYDVTTTYSVTINGKSISVLGQGGTVATTAAALLTALQASTVPPEFKEVTWTNPSGGQITGTAATAGVPFTAASGVSGGAGTFGAFSTTTASAGPNDVSSTANWSLGAVPVSTNDVYIDNGPDLLYGLSSLSAVTLNSLNIAASFTGNIGLPEVNASNYVEYRQRYLQVGATTCILGYGLGAGPTRVNIDFGSVQTACIVEQTGATQVTNLETAQLKGTNASNVLTVNRGSVAWGGYGTDTGNALATLNADYISSQASDAQVRTGPGTTVTTANINGGAATMWNSPTTLNQLAGSVAAQNGNITAATVDAGTFTYTGVGTITTLTIGISGTADFRTDPRSRTITNPVQMYAGAVYRDPFGSCGNVAFKLNRCRPADVTIDAPINKTITLS